MCGGLFAHLSAWPNNKYTGTETHRVLHLPYVEVLSY